MALPVGNNSALMSQWDGLSPHLLASFYEVEHIGQTHDWARVQNSPVVRAPLTESNLEVALGWHSPFEGNSFVDPKLSTMLQSGALQLQPVTNFMDNFDGRASITKLNSTQMFAGMPPVKITVTALFRAWSDPAKEVEAPFDQLMKWALPQHLEPDDWTRLKGVGRNVSSGKTMLETLKDAAAQFALPSQAPVKIGLTYKGRDYYPLVIESIAAPLSSPIDKNGNFVELLVPMALCSLTAIDRDDWSNASRSQGFST
jgi:hypothetical protein